MTCPSDMQLDRYWLDGQPRTNAIANHIGSCEDCQQRLATCERDASTFETEVFSDTIQSVRAALGEQPRARATQRWVLAWAAFGVCVMLAAFSFFASSPPDLGLKGPVGMQVFCNRGERVFQLQPGDALYPEDMLRFAPTLAARGYVMVVAVDVRGEAYVYAPFGGTRAIQVEAGAQALEGSVILDESVGEERIFLFYSHESFDFDVVRDAIDKQWRGSPASLMQLSLEGIQSMSLLFAKERTP